MTYDDYPTIRWSILKRLDKERGAKVCDIQIVDHKDYIAVGIEAVLDGMDGLRVTSVFHLPAQFELAHIHNETDQIAEQFKFARLDWWANGRGPTTGRPLMGTGTRGLWAPHGAA